MGSVRRIVAAAGRGGRLLPPDLEAPDRADHGVRRGRAGLGRRVRADRGGLRRSAAATRSRWASARARSPSSRATGTSTAWAARCASAPGWSRRTATPRRSRSVRRSTAVPESAAIGLTLLHGRDRGGGAGGRRVPVQRPGGALVGAPARRTRARRLRARPRAAGSAIVLMSGVAAALGYVLLDGASDNLVAWTQAFAGGAVLCMLADTMIPQAYEDYGRRPAVGLVVGPGLRRGVPAVDGVSCELDSADADADRLPGERSRRWRWPRSSTTSAS